MLLVSVARVGESARMWFFKNPSHTTASQAFCVCVCVCVSTAFFPVKLHGRLNHALAFFRDSTSKSHLKNVRGLTPALDCNSRIAKIAGGIYLVYLPQNIKPVRCHREKDAVLA